MSVQGRCLCGGVRYELDAPFRSMVHCHCSMCRKHHGALFATFLTGPIGRFRWLAGEALVGVYTSSAGVERRFCRTCGSSLPDLWDAEDEVCCPAGGLEEDPGMRPDHHIFAESAPEWAPITDGLPRFAAYPPGVGGEIDRLAVRPEPGLILGGCLCGAMAFEVDAEAVVLARNCHCRRCRRHTGAAHASNLFVALDAVRLRRGEELRTLWKLPEAERFASGFCSRCGSIAPRPIPQLGRCLIPMGALDTDPGMRPSSHIFVASKAPWFEITDGLPQYEGYAPA